VDEGIYMFGAAGRGGGVWCSEVGFGRSGKENCDLGWLLIF
jgi:hypothetical protein